MFLQVNVTLNEVNKMRYISTMSSLYVCAFNISLAGVSVYLSLCIPTILCWMTALDVHSGLQLVVRAYSTVTTLQSGNSISHQPGYIGVNSSESASAID